MRLSRTTALAACAVFAATAAIPSIAQASNTRPNPNAASKHVLLISVDGLHTQDLAWYAAQHPTSTLAMLSSGGATYTGAQTPIPSDSFPGMVGQVTGGNPKTTGVYYDVTYNHALLPAGTTNCVGATPGAAVNFDESLDLDNSSLDAGAGVIPPLSHIWIMPSNATSLINPALLPVDPTTCQPVYPHNYIKVNTVFEVAKRAGLTTAWSDKHPAYEILNGPSGTGVDDFFTPEINASDPNLANPAFSGDWTKNNFATRDYDGYKVQAVINEIDGKDHSGANAAAVPAIFGMNFQAVSTAEKLPSSVDPTTGTKYAGGYTDNGTVPGALLQGALGFVDSSLGQMVNELKAQGLMDSTTIIISAKHGQSPMNIADLTRIDDGAIVDGINADWKNQPNYNGTDLVVAATNDDALQMWLSDRSQAAADFVKSWLWSHSATGTTATGAFNTVGPNRTLDHSGTSAIYAGQAAADYFGVAASDPRHPDVWADVQHGVVYTGGTKKIAEHGGSGADDRDVALLVYGAGAPVGQTFGGGVETTQIAPTILELLGLNPNRLDAVRAEHTQVLPGIS